MLRQRRQQLEATLAFAENNAVNRDGLKERLQPLRVELRGLERTNLPPELPGAYAVREGAPIDVALQKAGDPDQPGPIVTRGVPRFLGDAQVFRVPPGVSGRLELARWLTAPGNPLTAR